MPDTPLIAMRPTRRMVRTAKGVKLQPPPKPLREARQLLEELKQSFSRFEQTLAVIIETKTWETLGYASFAEMWTAEMSNFTLFAELRPHVVYAYYDSGASVDEAARAIKGIGKVGAQWFKEQKDAGVPPSLASNHRGHRRGTINDFTVVREHPRKMPTPSDTIHLQVGYRMKLKYQRIASAVGKTVEEIASEAVRDKFAELAESSGN